MSGPPPAILKDVIWLGSIGIRYIEAGVILALVVSTVLLYLRRRPRGLVWWSALAMATMAAHLYLEEGRWQMAGVYALLFAFCFWVASPARHSYRVPGLILRIALTVLLVMPMLAVPFLSPLFRVPVPEGPHGVGVAILSASGSRVRFYYPAGESDQPSATYWTRYDIDHSRLPGIPRLLTWHLALVPLPATLRAPLEGTDLPALVVVPSPSSEPSDFVRLALEAASEGWLVAELQPAAGVEDVVTLLGGLQAGSVDSAFDGKVSAARVALLLGGQWPASSMADDNLAALGLPWIHVGGELGTEVTILGGHFAITFPDAEIPSAAYTTRTQMVEPPQLLVGSSDVPPSELAILMHRVVQLLLSDGSSGSPIFSGEMIDQSRLTAGIYGATYRALPVVR